MLKYFFAAVLLAVTTVSCLAAQEFYVVRSAKEGCSISTEKPDGVNKTLVGAAHPTRDEAKTAKKAAAECKPPEGKADDTSK